MSIPAAVYHLFSAEEVLLYIGAAEDPEVRWKHHSYKQPWWPEVDPRLTTVQWHPDRETALAAEEAAIKAERPRYNIIHAPVRPPRPERVSSAPRQYLSTTEAADEAGVTRYTVEREIGRGNLAAQKVGTQWVIEETEADRWRAQYRPYAEQRDRPHAPPAAG